MRLGGDSHQSAGKLWPDHRSISRSPCSSTGSTCRSTTWQRCLPMRTGDMQSCTAAGRMERFKPGHWLPLQRSDWRTGCATVAPRLTIPRASSRRFASVVVCYPKSLIASRGHVPVPRDVRQDSEGNSGEDLVDTSRGRNWIGCEGASRGCRGDVPFHSTGPRPMRAVNVGRLLWSCHGFAFRSSGLGCVDCGSSTGALGGSLSAIHAIFKSALSLRHGDLHALDMVSVPEELHGAVGKWDKEHAVHHPPTETK
jgi:hypothetical protein